MPLPLDFASESLYTSDQWYLHDLLEVDEQRVLARMDTTRIGALVAAQVPWPGQPQHIPGTVMVQATGTLGNLHTVYGLGLRLTEGWVGYGTHIEKARFLRRGTIGPAMDAELRATRVRRLRGNVVVTYTFRFTQAGEEIYASEQTAAWFRTEHRGPSA